MKKFFFSFLFLFSSLWSWWDLEHMTIAKMVYDELSEEEKAKVDRLIHVLDPFYPNMNTFISAAVWADDVASRDFPPGKKWHSHPKPYDPTHFLSKERKQKIEEGLVGQEIISGIHQCIETLKNPKSTLLEKGIMLRYLIHLVGDIHMPLHCGFFYSADFPHSDIAGSKFPIMVQGKKTTINLLWNSAFGRGSQRPKLPPTKQNQEEIDEFAKELVASFPKEKLPILQDKDISHWAEESYEIVENGVYEGISLYKELPLDYIEKNRKLAYERLAISAYRLAAILHEILQEDAI